MMRALGVGVLGAGSWGTRVGAGRRQHADDAVRARSTGGAGGDLEHRNSRYLGDRVLPGTLRASSDLAEVVAGADVLVPGVPSQPLRSVLASAAPFLRPWVPVISLTKGLEAGSRKRATEAVAEELPGHPVGLLPGPNLAREVLDGFTAAAVIATADARRRRLRAARGRLHRRAKIEHVYGFGPLTGCATWPLSSRRATAAASASPSAAGVTEPERFRALPGRRLRRGSLDRRQSRPRDPAHLTKGPP